MANSKSRAILGTSVPLLIPRDGDSSTVRIGKDYFLIRIFSAQAVFKGTIWSRVNRLIVTTQVDVGSGAVRAIQRSREVQPDHAIQLGIATNLIDLMPSSVPSVSISVDFILDRKNYLASLVNLINSDSFIAAASLVPSAAGAAKTIAGLSDKIISTFLPHEDQKPILQFTADLDFGTGGFKEGYYAVLGSQDERNPLPEQFEELEVKDGALWINKQRSINLSYIIFDVRRTEARTRALGKGTAWDGLLSKAEDEAQLISDDPLATDSDRADNWEQCRKLIREAQSLLRADPNYLRNEAQLIIADSLEKCRAIFSNTTRSLKRSAWVPDFSSEVESLNLSDIGDLHDMLHKYARQVVATRKTLKSLNM